MVHPLFTWKLLIENTFHEIWMQLCWPKGFSFWRFICFTVVTGFCRRKQVVSLLLSLKNLFVHHNLSLSSLSCSLDSELVPISLLRREALLD